MIRDNRPLVLVGEDVLVRAAKLYLLYRLLRLLLRAAAAVLRTAWRWPAATMAVLGAMALWGTHPAGDWLAVALLVVVAGYYASPFSAAERARRRRLVGR